MLHVGVISDTHCAGRGDLPRPVLDALRGVDLILHCGDLEVLGVLDCLEQVAPVLAVRGYEDPFEPGPRLADRTRVVELGPLRLGMVHDIGWPGPRVEIDRTSLALAFPPLPLEELLRRKFGTPVDAVLFGDSHEEMALVHQGVLFFNPGSPTCPGTRHRPGDLGTLGILRVHGRHLRAEVRKLRW